ncbi:hypothetical protein HIM_06605 [Hirsutella minnesotensis 3608]|uniref:Uncharacterized protein n=1 Tax=Hirsutella minnesotensis 3608 TaxID=1043627 RepID=A0A0F7ZZB6_9HYPO|nr:hypothetical protein HIM_06605 [Hirsutella minnesotensis 3608]
MRDHNAGDSTRNASEADATSSVNDVYAAGAEVLLDDHGTRVWFEDRLADLKVVPHVVVGEMPETPLRPDQVVLNPILGLPALQLDVQVGAYAALPLSTSVNLDTGSTTSTCSAIGSSKPSMSVTLPILCDGYPWIRC